MAKLSLIQEMVIERISGKSDVRKVKKIIASWSQDKVDERFEQALRTAKRLGAVDPFDVRI